jgi:hypothetical protein
MKKSYLILFITAFVILIAVISNPNKDKHRSVFKNKILTYKMADGFQDKSNNNLNEWETEGDDIDTIFDAELADYFVNNLITSDNYLIFSTTKVIWHGKSKTIGIGAFGIVYLSNQSKDILKSNAASNIVNQYYLEQQAMADSIAAAEAAKGEIEAASAQATSDSLAAADN